MIGTIRNIFLVAALALPTHAFAQSAPAGGDDSRQGSPYRISWARELAILGLAGGGLGLADIVSSEIVALTEAEISAMDRRNVLWFDRSATHRYSLDQIRRSEQIASPLAYVPFVLLLDSRVRSDWQALTVMYVQSTLLASAASELTKELIPRYRPYVYNDGLTYEERTDREPGKAFMSSAAAYAFARAVLLATVFSDYHPDSQLRPFVWAGALGAAGTVGYLRYSSGIHYPSDVIAGAAVGAAIGYFVPRLHRIGGDAVTLQPHAGSNGMGLQLTLNF